jgi:hypothetical protein
MKRRSLTHTLRNHFLPLLLLLGLAACQGCQGRGRVHEAPPASFPDGAASNELPAPSPAEPPPPEELAPKPSGEDYAEPPASLGAAEGSQAPAKAKPGAPDFGYKRGAVPESRSRDDLYAERPRPEERPGLATHWGENRYSPAREVDFERADGDIPAAVVQLHYNDRGGARQMLPGGYWDHAETSVLGGLRVRILDDRGRALPALRQHERVIGVGAPGERYSLVIENSTSTRYEVVASVDGLDVLDGEDASFEKRGYLVGAYSSVVIDGFRRSQAEVAAFRLGDVGRSYAASKGKARNVGVIGFAFFGERRPVYQPSPWRDRVRNEDTDRRRNADPFPGRYAEPPVW